MLNKLLLIIAIIILSACSPSPELINEAAQETLAAYPTWTSAPTYTIQATYTSLATQTPLPTYTAVPTIVITQIIVVTPTSTPTPQFTPTETLTPTVTLTPTPTQDPLMMDKGPGYYLVNVDIAPGIWRSMGDKTNDGCYWARLDRTGDLIDNYYGYAGATIYISPRDFAVELKADCGNWTYLGPP